MPAYNAERFLAEAIQRILSQTHRHFELSVVDVGSTDGTQKIIDDFADQDERVRPSYVF
jgi:teichuronic acid biosynthesis glycosyltransferase TuaG